MISANLIYEAESGLVKGLFKDNGPDIGIQPATLSVMIFDRDTETVIKTTTNLTPVVTYVDVNGNLTYYIAAGDNVIQTIGKEKETHVIRFIWTWTAQAATQTGKQELQFDVINLTP